MYFQVFTLLDMKKEDYFMTKKLMKTLLVAVCMFCFGFANTADAAQSPGEIKTKIVKTAVSMGVDPCVALSIAKLESEFYTDQKRCFRRSRVISAHA